MTAIPNRVRARLDEVHPDALRDALAAVLDKTDRWRDNQISRAFADEILLALAGPLGLDVRMGRFAQLEDHTPED